MSSLCWPSEPSLSAVAVRPTSGDGALAAPAWGVCESLAQSLRAVLLARGVDRPYAEVVALLGLGARFRVSLDDCVAEWALLAQDAHLIAVAAAYGLQLREMHPPPAADGLVRSPEYGQHFIDSYLPLVRRALQHDQPNIVRRGWPPPYAPAWGVITAAEGDSLRGYTLGGERGATALTGPAVQVYVVEAFEQRPADAWEAGKLLLLSRESERIDGAQQSDVYAAAECDAVIRRLMREGALRRECIGCGRDVKRCYDELAANLEQADIVRRAWQLQASGEVAATERPR